jgi:DnaJ-class molecular chaperone
MPKDLKFFKLEDCPLCFGNGVIITIEDNSEETETICPLCEGKGMLRLSTD